MRFWVKNHKIPCVSGEKSQNSTYCRPKTAQAVAVAEWGGFFFRHF